MIRVAIVDDHPVVREGIRQIVTGTDDIVVTLEATTGRDLTHQIPDADVTSSCSICRCRTSTVWSCSSSCDANGRPCRCSS